MRYDQPELQEKLAAEYVLGTQSYRVRRRFIKIAKHNKQLQIVIAQWESRLSPLGEGIKPVEPHPRVWQKIISKIGKPLSLAHSGYTKEKRLGFWESINFWRPLALGSSAVAFVLLVFLLFPIQKELPVQQSKTIAVLMGKEAKPVMVVTADPNTRNIVVKVLQQEDIPKDRDLELWALPTGGAPKSLGVVNSTGVTQLKLSNTGLANVPAMAISIEPKGGSPSGAPTGPVVYQGAVIDI